jgi:hypothetical protein
MMANKAGFTHKREADSDSAKLTRSHSKLRRQQTMRKSLFASDSAIQDLQPIDLSEMQQTGHAMFCIKTVAGGFNSGRTYCFRTCTECDLCQIISDLMKKAKAAREKHQAKTHFQKCQQRVGAVFHSDAFQFIASFLISMVRNRQRASCCCNIAIANCSIQSGFVGIAVFNFQFLGRTLGNCSH